VVWIVVVFLGFRVVFLGPRFVVVFLGGRLVVSGGSSVGGGISGSGVG
jgi:hypothetical protein